MIRWNWKRISDGEPLTRIRVSHNLTRNDLVNLLACHWQADPDKELTLAEIEKRIREQLAMSATARYYWHEEMTAEEIEELKAWAERQIAKL